MLIRRIITRLIVLGVDIEKAMPMLVASMCDSVTNIENKQQVSSTLIDFFFSEFKRFQGTISRGQRQLALFLKENNNNSLSEEQIGILEKKWGMPSLLTKLVLQKGNLSFRTLTLDAVTIDLNLVESQDLAKE